MIGFKLHFRLRPDQSKEIAGSVEIFLFDGGYAGLEPIENGLTNFCLVVQKTLYKACENNWPKFLNMLFRTLPHLAVRLQQAEPCWGRPLAIFGIPYGFLYQGDGPPGLYRLGDQMAVIPSFCGDGLAIALHTAQLASAQAFKQNSRQQNSRAYHRQARVELGSQIRNATRLLRYGSSPLLQKTVHLACRINPDLLAMTARMTRRTIRPAV